MYTIKCYEKTGFNPVNIPDGPEIIDALTPILTQELDVLQDRMLPSVNVRATYDTIKNVDYCKIGACYYSVQGVTMVAVDTAVLAITYDALTSAGGPASLTYLDGMTERLSVSEDNLFEYTQADELMTPQEPIQITTPVMYYGGAATDANTTVVIESTIDLTALAAEFNEDGYLAAGTGAKFVDPTDESNSVVVPTVKAVSGQTTYTIGTDETASVVKAPNTRQYLADSSEIQKALSIVRSLGVEEAIISQVVYPTRFVSVVSPSDGDPHVQRIVGLEQSLKAGSNFNYYTDAKNKRLNYGEFNKFCLLTSKGDKGEYLPEQIGSADDDAPYIKMKADPRPDGKPYFRFAKYMGDDSDSGFWIGSLTGLQWANAPLVYTSASNSLYNRLMLQNSSQSAYNTWQSNARSARSQIVPTEGSMTSLLNQTISDVAYEGASALAQGVPAYLKDVFTTGQQNRAFSDYFSGNKYDFDIGNQTSIEEAYDLSRIKELYQYGFSQSVVVPQVEFPFSADTIRDFKGNGVYFYRWHYSENDAARIDKLLTMYGYKASLPVSADIFSTRTYFNYVSATGISLGGDLPAWERNLIAAQLAAGVRVWHVKPDPSYYTSGNPIKESA